MYLGTTQKNQPSYYDKYLPGIGTVTSVKQWGSVTYHRYQCDNCGAIHEIPNKADEPFYCHDCGAIHLISIDSEE